MGTYDLVMEGGGAKGIVFVGAMQEFLARGNQPGRLIGTSAGAITAALVAAGYTAGEMLASLNEQVEGKPVFTTFMSTPGAFSDEEKLASLTAQYLREINVPLLPDGMENRIDQWTVDALLMHPGFRHLFSFVERGGWYAADNFLGWFAGKLDSGEFNGAPRRFSGMTLEEFFAATGTQLTLVASDVTAKRMLVLNHITAPDLPLIWAVRMSMNIPLLWQEVIWLEEWGLYRTQRIAGNKIVDGGLLSNFPMELLISDLPHVTAVMGPKTGADILGLLIDEDQAVPDASGGDAPGVLPAMGGVRTLDRMRNLLDTLMGAHDKMVIDAFERLVVRLPAKDFGTTEFDMSEARRNALVVAGRNAMRAYLDRPMASQAPSPAEQAALQRAKDEADAIAARILER